MTSGPVIPEEIADKFTVAIDLESCLIYTMQSERLGSRKGGTIMLFTEFRGIINGAYIGSAGTGLLYTGGLFNTLIVIK